MLPIFADSGGVSPHKATNVAQFLTKKIADEADAAGADGYIEPRSERSGRSYP